MLTAKKKAILYEFVVDLLVKRIISHKYPDNHIKKSIIKKIFRSYLTKHGVSELFSPIHLSTIFTECKIITPMEDAEKEDETVYRFSSERLLDLTRKFSRVGKFCTVKGLIDPEPTELYIHHCGTFSTFAPGDKPCNKLFCGICDILFDTPRHYEDHMMSHVNNDAPSPGRKIPQSFKFTVVEITMRDIVLEIANILEVFQVIYMIVLISPSFENVTILKSSCPIKLDAGKRVVLRVHRKVFQDIFEVMSVWNIAFKFFRTDIFKATEVYSLMNYDRNEYVKKVVQENKTKYSDTLLSEKSLQHYPTYEMESLFKRHFNLSDKASSQEVKLHEKLKDFTVAKKPTRLHLGNYVEVMSHSLQIEELSVNQEVAKYNKSNQRLHYRSHELYSLNIPDISGVRSSILPNDRVTLVLQSQCESMKTCCSDVNDMRKICGSIVRIENDCIVVRLREIINTREQYHVSFQPNRANFQVQAHALNLLKNSPKLQSILFPTEAPMPRALPAGKEPIWFNKHVAQNSEQKRAVIHIVAGTAYPYPYIIFGPPGTGKTMTLVESVCQLWKQQPNSHILISAHSNGACDEICVRLLRYLPSCDILRLLSMVREKELETMDPELLNVANTKNGRIFYPPMRRIYQYRIVICTITMAGKMVQARIDTNHFTHVFIDESGCCTETQTIVPIVGIVANEHNVLGQIILAGDHKQLGPVLSSSLAKDRDFHISTMERLIKSPAYQKDIKTKVYNTNLVTNLLHNYRSCPPILDVSNTLFYDNELIPDADNNWAVGWKFLPNKSIPIVMDPIVGVCQRDSDSPSYFNAQEILAVMEIVREILTNGINSRKITQREVGIITPYRKQVTKIRQMCDIRNWSDIDVASVEHFQGTEKEVIVVSTVRSNIRTLGFLIDPKRLNVMLTRAKALFVIVGNPDTLKHDKHWGTVVDLYKKYGLITSLTENIRFASSFDNVLSIVTEKFNRITL